MSLDEAQKALDDLKWDPAERFARRPVEEQKIIREATLIFAKAKKQYQPKPPKAPKKAAPKAKKAAKKDDK